MSHKAGWFGDDDEIRLAVVGKEPKHKPYLSVRSGDDMRFYGSVHNKHTLRAIAHAILRAIGDEP